MLSDDDLDSISREESPCSDSPRPASLDIDNSLDNMCTSVSTSTSCSASTKPHLKVGNFKNNFQFHQIKTATHNRQNSLSSIVSYITDGILEKSISLLFKPSH